MSVLAHHNWTWREFVVSFDMVMVSYLLVDPGVFLIVKRLVNRKLETTFIPGL
jgi:hypothetical protein